MNGMIENPEIKVAYVEDEPSIAKLLASGLGLFGILVHPLFMSSEELLENIDQPELADVDMLFFDIRLPGINGMELAGQLRDAGEKRPFVIVSAWPRPPQSELDAIRAKFLPKPFDFPDVIRTVQKLKAGE